MSYQQDESLDGVTLRRVFLQLVREIYAYPENYGTLRARLERFKWSEDDHARTLQVELDFQFDPENLQPRHAIYVGVSDIDFSAQYLNNEAAVSEDRSRTTYVQNAQTVLQLRCITPSADESYHLATVGAAALMGLRPVIMAQMGLERFNLLKIGAPNLRAKNESRLLEVVATVAIAFPFSIVSSVESLRLKSVQVRTVPLTT